MQKRAGLFGGAGLRVLERNYRCRYGEIDLIVRDGEMLDFIEERLRRDPNFGGTLTSVDHFMRERLAASAQHYMQILSRMSPARFDVIAIDQVECIAWVHNAFEA
jgi:putative endonuclease